MQDLDASWLQSNVLKLVPDTASRNKTVSKCVLRTGSSILSTLAFATILLESEKGRRCDTCFRLSSNERPLRRCSGCGSYWYCDAQCQAFQWRTHHKRMCKVYNSYIGSLAYQALPEHEKLDSLLLSHTLAQMSLWRDPYAFQDSSPSAVLLSLIPSPGHIPKPPAVCPISPIPPSGLLGEIYSRFGNNNFTIHSHLTTIGHGIFPFASRLFNHSCVPNAAAKYTLSPGEFVTMEIVALRDIQPDEEICLPYLDPALLQSRQQILELSYGFKCDCSACNFLSSIGKLPELPKDSSELMLLARQLRDFVGVHDNLGPELPDKPIELTPPTLYCVLQEEYLSSLSATFSEASHEGQHELAMDSGMTLLAWYILVYPPNYPQIGMHVLELAKTAWNARICSADFSGDDNQTSEEQVRVLVALARQLLSVYGPEGDEVGPLQEIETLAKLLEDD